jgi:hypothetical protein
MHVHKYQWMHAKTCIWLMRTCSVVERAARRLLDQTLDFHFSRGTRTFG